MTIDNDELEAIGARLTDSILASYERSSRLNYRSYRRALELSGLADAHLTVREAVQSTARNFATAELLYLQADPEYPMIVKMISVPGKSSGGPNPDCNYQQASLHGDHSYRISGNRGSAALFDIQVNTSSPADPMNARFVSSLDAMGYEIAPGEDMEVVLSTEKHDGHWLPLPEGAATILIRQVYNDWDNESPAMLVIERVGASYPPPPPTPEQLEKRVQAMNSYLHNLTDVLQLVAANYLKEGANSLHHIPIPSTLGFAAYEYLWGNYVCKSDEAVVLEFKMPRTRYGAVNIHNLVGDDAEFHLRHTSINGYQGQTDSDGIFRVVISHDDPGTRNWLDASGRGSALLAARFYKPDEVPVPRLKVVPFDKVRDYLPKDTALVTPAERQEIMRRRLLSVYRRLITDY
ncbi:MAG: DUF1214 domain-containing protein [Gammaproteobacteria bacterium]|nr:DUF1214 domain-containing protein [Gammaproteobacteria bacterium]MDE0367255.1 DUF1214 domain-containing protein [Gammaproteobacteria bacterium]